MKTKLLLGAAVAAFTLTSFAAEPLLSPRAAGNQPKVASSVTGPATTIAYVAATPAVLSPRAAGNQLKVVKGIANDTTPAAVCRANMNGTPRAIAECGSHANMPGCSTVAACQ